MTWGGEKMIAAGERPGGKSVALEIRRSSAGNVVRIIGRLDSSLTADERQQILAEIREGEVLTLDFSAVTQVSAVGLRLLLLLSHEIHNRGSELALQHVPEEILSLADAVGFLRLFREPASPERRPHVLPPVPRIDVYPTHYHGDLALRRGFPMPLGATTVARGINFAVYSRHATSVTLLLRKRGTCELLAEIPIPEEFRTGDVHAVTVFDLDADLIEYGYRVDGPFEPEKGHRFDASVVLLDPTARAIGGRERWGVSPRCTDQSCWSQIVPEDFDWESDQPLGLPLEELVIYELHVRGFTRSPSSNVRHPGTYAGLREKIPYLKQLGINCVELMPVFEFNELEVDRINPITREPLINYWGYSTVAFYAPKASYAASGKVGMQVDELKALIKELHTHGIEVVLDVVFNHTSELGDGGPTNSFRGFDNRTWYMLAPDGSYFNFSGCGNTLNCNHPIVRDFVINCLRYWVSEYHIDGFRFDLASILGRALDGSPLANPPLLEALAMDPVLGRTKLIAEAWDAGGLYQVGTFPSYGRWAEWNGKYRDCVRRFLKGDDGVVPEMVQRLIGSPDVYPTRGPAASINFVTCHDGFTLADLVSYNTKHNEANGEQNRDGANDNNAWNCGVEGPTQDPTILALRLRQQRNALAILFLSQGVPMMLMGDECGRTQSGNNNAYCHDGPLTWLDWTLVETNADLFRFCRELIAFRKRHPALRHVRHVGSETSESELFEVTWHGTEPDEPDWSLGSRSLAMLVRLRNETVEDVIYAAFNLFWDTLTFRLPAPPEGYCWAVAMDTSLPPPLDMAAPGNEHPLEANAAYPVASRTVVVLILQPAEVR